MLVQFQSDLSAKFQIILSERRHYIYFGNDTESNRVKMLISRFRINVNDHLARNLIIDFVLLSIVGGILVSIQYSINVL